MFSCIERMSVTRGRQRPQRRQAQQLSASASTHLGILLSAIVRLYFWTLNYIFYRCFLPSPDCKMTYVAHPPFASLFSHSESLLHDLLCSGYVCQRTHTDQQRPQRRYISLSVPIDYAVPTRQTNSISSHSQYCEHPWTSFWTSHFHPLHIIYHIRLHSRVRTPSNRCNRPVFSCDVYRSTHYRPILHGTNDVIKPPHVLQIVQSFQVWIR